MQGEQDRDSKDAHTLALVYSENETLPIGEHLFQSGKYRGIRERLLQAGAFTESEFISAPPCEEDDLLLVHTRRWVDKLRTGTLSVREELELELPYSKELVEAFRHVTGGSILAARQALQNHCCVHIGGGFHHAFSDHGEGFCLINDVAVAIRRMQRDGLIERAMVIDCDAHQGNGTAAIFGNGEPEPFPPPSWSVSLLTPKRTVNVKTSAAGDVFTLSLHQESNYPHWKPASSMDVNLPDGTTDGEYLEWLQAALNSAWARFEPELICYVAGADPYRGDQLAGLAMTIEGLRQRDLMVFHFARDHGFPIMTTLAGGYAQNPEDTVIIHANTALAAKEAFG
jgi:acetoin utilization deacetylase AcuC-like enzyme